MTALLALWLQRTPDLRSMSWWLPSGPAREIVWWGVFSLNLAVLLWVLWKMLYGGKTWSVPRMLRSRGETIQRQMQEAEQAHRQAEARLAEIGARLANLPAEIAALEREAATEAGHEYERVLEESRREAERILQQGRKEIEAAAKVARKELQGLAAALAVDLATQHIREQLTPEEDEVVVRSALAGLSRQRRN
ncbi:MAG: ATP synthase F0 subunit B [Terriglobales bacterium]